MAGIRKTKVKEPKRSILIIRGLMTNTSPRYFQSRLDHLHINYADITFRVDYAERVVGFVTVKESEAASAIRALESRTIRGMRLNAWVMDEDEIREWRWPK